MTLTRIWLPSPNYSANRRLTRLLVIHAAEGARTFRELGNYFAHPSVQASSQVGIDDTPDQIGEYVRHDAKAWTAFAANDWGEHAELCGFANWSREEWLKHPTMLNNTYAWLREESARYNIPFVKVNADEIRAGHAGVCGHKDVTDAGAGGDHWDPGPNFPWDLVLYTGSGTSFQVPVPPAPTPTGTTAPLFPGRYLRLMNPMMSGDDVRVWQTKMRSRGWAIAADGFYGAVSASICRQFQREKGLVVDGIVGPTTWNATWMAPLT